LFNFRKLSKLDNWFILIILLLCTIGGLTIFSSTYFFKNSVSQLFYNQIIFYILGFIIFGLLSILNVAKLNRRFVIFSIAVFSTILLIIVLYIGNVAYGAQRWIDIGPFTIQPSEFAKVAVIMVTAYCFTYNSKRKLEKVFDIYKTKPIDNIKIIIEFIKTPQFIKFLISLIFLLITIILVIKQKSLGNSILITLIYLIILLYITQIKYIVFFYLTPIILSVTLSIGLINLSNLYLRFNIIPQIFGIDIIVLIIFTLIILVIKQLFKLNIFILFLLFICFLPTKFIVNFSYDHILEAYQRQRIQTFLNPTSSNALDEDYNREKSIEAIGSSKLLGKGFLQGNIVNSGLLPFAYTDFVYAAYVEQFGFIGAFILLLLYYLLLTKIIVISLSTNNKFLKIISFGVAVMIILNIIQNVGMNMGILPITGVPLPLISSGGSSVIVIFIGLGLVNSIHLDNLSNTIKVTKIEL